MRTTLEIDDDVLQAAKDLAAREGKTAGRVISELARRGIQAPARSLRGRPGGSGFEVLPASGRLVTPELVQRILEESEDR